MWQRCSGGEIRRGSGWGCRGREFRPPGLGLERTEVGDGEGAQAGGGLRIECISELGP